MSPAEAVWLMAGSLLEFLEIGGPDAVREQLGELSRSQREDVVRAVRDCGFPARETLEDFRVLVAEPILGARSRPRAVRNAPARRLAGENAAVADNARTGPGLIAGISLGPGARTGPPKPSRVGIIVWCPYHRMLPAPRISRAA